MISLKQLALHIKVLGNLTRTSDEVVKDMVETLALTADNIKQDWEREAAAKQAEEARNAQQRTQAENTIDALTNQVAGLEQQLKAAAAVGRLEGSMPEATVAGQDTMGGEASSAGAGDAQGGGLNPKEGDAGEEDESPGSPQAMDEGGSEQQLKAAAAVGRLEGSMPEATVAGQDTMGKDSAAGGDARGGGLNPKEGDAREEEEEEETSAGSPQAMDDDLCVQDVTEMRARKRSKTAIRPPANIPAEQQTVVETLANHLYRMIPGIGYRKTVEACLHVLFQHTGFMPLTSDMFKWLAEKTRALSEEARVEIMDQFKGKQHYKQSMQRVLDFLLDDSADTEVMNSTVKPGVEGQVYMRARKCGLGMGEQIFRKVLAEGLGQEPLASMEDFEDRMQKEETRQRFVEFYENSDNPKKGVVCRIYDAAGLSSNALLRMNRKKAPGENGAQRRIEHPSVPLMSAVEQQIYDKARAAGLNLYEAVFRKVLADKKLPPWVLESWEAFTAHMRKPETQAELLAYNQTCDNQKKGVVAMLFTISGVDASFLKSSVRKRHAGAVNLITLGIAAVEAQAAPVLYDSRQWPGAAYPNTSMEEV